MSSSLLGGEIYTPLFPFSQDVPKEIRFLCTDQPKTNLFWLIEPRIDTEGISAALNNPKATSINEFMDKVTRRHLQGLPLAFLEYWKGIKGVTSMELHWGVYLGTMTRRAHEAQARILAVESVGNVVKANFKRWEMAPAQGSLPATSEIGKLEIQHFPNTIRIRRNEGLVNNGNDTVTDVVTGLMWMKSSMGQTWNGKKRSGAVKTYSWNDAMTIQHTFAGYSDWRLPTLKELKSIVDPVQRRPSINIGIFDQTPPTSFWTSSPYDGKENSAWKIDFGTGATGNALKRKRFAVRLVRRIITPSPGKIGTDLTGNNDVNTHTEVNSTESNKNISQTEDIFVAKGSCFSEEIEAQVRLAQKYQDGDGVPCDLVKAAELYMKAAEEGHMTAQNNLGIIHSDVNSGVVQDQRIAEHWLRKAAEQGLDVAQYNLANLLLEMDGEFYDPEQAAIWFRRSADQGDSDAQNSLGTCHEEGIGVPIDIEQAIFWYCKASEQGNADAQSNLLRLRNESLSQHAPEQIPASTCFELQIAQAGTGSGTVTRRPPFLTSGEAVCASYLAGTPVTLLATPKPGSVFTGWTGDTVSSETTCTFVLSENHALTANFSLAGEDKSRFLLREYENLAERSLNAARLGNENYKNDVNITLSSALGTHENIGENQPESQGSDIANNISPCDDNESQFKLGKRYHEGDGVPRDYGKAAECYLNSAIAGNAKAQNNLGLLYSSGLGVPKNKKEAASWYMKAADQGLDVAQYNIASCFLEENGVLPYDPEQAALWYVKAAEQGHSGAQFSLGEMYEEGLGVPQDIHQAKFFYLKAALQDDEAAQSWLWRRTRFERAEESRQTESNSQTQTAVTHTDFSLPPDHAVALVRAAVDLLKRNPTAFLPELAELRGVVLANSAAVPSQAASSEASPLSDETPSLAMIAKWLLGQETVTIFALRAYLLPLGFLPEAVINDINERALDLIGEPALEEDGETLVVDQELLAEVLAHWQERT